MGERLMPLSLDLLRVFESAAR
ncbi:UNVERIFIED_CONTAM: hypothetical protein QO022_26530, partial [Pseudomonas aeruginosa]